MAWFGWSERLGECNKFMAFSQRHNIQWLFSCAYAMALGIPVLVLSYSVILAFPTRYIHTSR